MLIMKIIIVLYLGRFKFVLVNNNLLRLIVGIKLNDFCFLMVEGSIFFLGCLRLEKLNRFFEKI